MGGDDTGRFLLLCGPPGGGLTSVIRHLWRSEKRRHALVDLGGFPADQRLLARALLGQLLPDRKVTSAPAKKEQLQRARSFGQIIGSPIVAVTVVAEPDDALDLLCESLTGVGVDKRRLPAGLPGQISGRSGAVAGGDEDQLLCKHSSAAAS